MSLEQQISDLTAALKENTAVTKALLDARQEAFEIAKGAVSKSSPAKGKDEAKKDEQKGADAPKQNITTSPEDRKDPYDGLKELVASYIGGTTREEERDARKAKVVKLLNHDKIKKPDLPADAKPDTMNIKEDAIEMFKKNMAKFIDEGDLTKPATSGDDLDI